MGADPVLVRLVSAERSTRKAHRDAAAALAAYRGEASAEAEKDLVTLKEGEAEFGMSNRQLRRWATEENLGRLIDGRWHLSRTLVRRHKDVQACLATMSK